MRSQNSGIHDGSLRCPDTPRTHGIAARYGRHIVRKSYLCVYMKPGKRRSHPDGHTGSPRDAPLGHVRLKV